jgi:hypothetical protein
MSVNVWQLSGYCDPAKFHLNCETIKRCRLPISDIIPTFYQQDCVLMDVFPESLPADVYMWGRISGNILGKAWCSLPFLFPMGVSVLLSGSFILKLMIFSVTLGMGCLPFLNCYLV